MNYRHAYHAGNWADCFKHALLIVLLDGLTRKQAPFFVLDSHAGTGHYDLHSEQSRRTAEADAGIRRLLISNPPALAHYLALVRKLGLYPGSPALIRSVMRESDHLACCELHSDDVAILRRKFQRDPLVEIHERSGWEALGALLPPKQRRGLVFIDPPFEAADEFATLAAGLQRAHNRFAHGVIAAWYPIKQMAAVRLFHASLTSSGMRDIVCIEMYLRDPSSPDRLNGCGLTVINAPYRFEDEAGLAAGATLAGISNGEQGAGIAVNRLVDE